jgi:GNAT superfamily N-acetyltransferase
MPPPTLVIRPCGLGDIASLGSLLKTCWHAAYDPILGQREATDAGRRVYSKFQLGLWVLQSILVRRGWTMLVALQGGDMIGLAMAHLDEAGVVLYMLYVRPDRQGQGVGSALLDAVLARYPSAKAIRLEVLKDNTAAIAWYRTKGFETYGGTKNATGILNIAAVYMDKKLDQFSESSFDKSASTGKT